MIIVQITNVMGRANLWMRGVQYYDGVQLRAVPETHHLARIDIDATGAINTDDIAGAVYMLARYGGAVLGEVHNLSWHDVL